MKRTSEQIRVYEINAKIKKLQIKEFEAFLSYGAVIFMISATYVSGIVLVILGIFLAFISMISSATEMLFIGCGVFTLLAGTVLFNTLARLDEKIEKYKIEIDKAKFQKFLGD